jgi:hypothetical protein
MPFTPAALRFFRGLAKHNDKEWFEAHRADYEREVREPMRDLTRRQRSGRRQRRFLLPPRAGEIVRRRRVVDAAAAAAQQVAQCHRQRP